MPYRPGHRRINDPATEASKSQQGAHRVARHQAAVPARAGHAEALGAAEGTTMSGRRQIQLALVDGVSLHPPAQVSATMAACHAASNVILGNG
jgi:hypothetical protein